MKVATIALANLRRMLRERSNIFFVFILPLALILLIGAQFYGESNPRVGLHLADDSPLARAVAAELESESLEVVGYASSEDLVAAVERGRVVAGVFLPSGMDDAAPTGLQYSIGYVARPQGAGQQLQSVVAAAVDRVLVPVAAARFTVEKTGAEFDAALTAAQDESRAAPGLDVEVSAIGDVLFPPGMGRFDLPASSQLVLFVFLTAMAGSAALISSRRLGLSTRMLSTPTPVGVIVLGEAAGRWAVAMFQGLYIVAVTLVVFGVNWGDPVGAALILVAFSAVGAGAGMLMGAVFSNDQQAGGIAVVLSLGLAALGGAMFPIELFSPTMAQVAHLTPHAWALSGLAELTRTGGTPPDVLPQLGVLTGYAVVLITLASWRLRISITRP